VRCGTAAAFGINDMGSITTLRRPGTPEACVVGDHVYLVLDRAELVSVVAALHLAGDQAIEQRLAKILRQLPESGRPDRRYAESQAKTSVS
jgi:hypothetical protein